MLQLHLIRKAFHSLGGLSLVRRSKRGWLRILMYHRFPAGLRARLEEQCAHIAQCYRPLSLTEAARRLHGRQPLPPNALAVTIDDGYGDFLQVAYPVFFAFGIPVTVFLTTGFLDGEWMWGDRVVYAFEHTKQQKFECCAPSGEELSLPLDSIEQRRYAAARVKALAKQLPDAERRRWIQELPDALGVRLPATPPPGLEPLRWEDLRGLTKNVDFGAHTRTHPILSRMPSEDDLRSEIAGSKRRIEQELQRPVAHFCYPNGLWSDINEDVVRAAREAEYETAAMAVPGLNPPEADLFRLRRIPVDPSYSLYQFSKAAAGFRL